MQFDQLKRREFLSLIGGTTVAWPLAARAQQPERMRRIGVLMAYSESDREGQADVAAFRQELQRLGWIEGRNLRIDSRWAALDAEAMERFAKELVALRPDLIFSQSTPTTATLLRQTRTVPIIFANVADPVGSGFLREPVAAGRQRHRLHYSGGLGGRQMAGAAQGDCAARCPGCLLVQPRNGALC